MKTKLFAAILSICLLLLPLSVSAKGYTVASDMINSNIVISDTSIDAKVSAGSSDVDIEYVNEEQSEPSNVPDIGCKAVYLIHPETGKVIYEKNSLGKMYPASTTKIMTALMALENCKMDEKIVVSEKALSLVPEGYSSAKLEAGEEFDVYTLLKALLIPSGNEVANVFALHISGDIDSFAALCNKRAAEIGCTNLHFINPNGVHNENHYCCAKDMYLIARECMKHEAFRDIVKTKSFSVPTTDIHPENDRLLYNTNELLLDTNVNYSYKYCTGIKTGHTEEAGECLISSASKDGVELMCIVLGGSIRSDGLNERFYDTKRLYEYAYSNNSFTTISNKDETLLSLVIDNATQKTKNLELTVNSDIKAFVPNSINKDNVNAVVSLYENIKAPIKKGDSVGKITFKADGLNYTADLIAKSDVKQQPYSLIIIIAVFVFLLFVLRVRNINRKRRRKSRRR